MDKYGDKVKYIHQIELLELSNGVFELFEEDIRVGEQ